ncbi:Major allergen Alt a 1 [Ascochyta rabiei]|uniref:Uncharacterized protein n=1 Tax=Didymella rabiei TaxID=5454 RepID=A0A162V965_DIDRA|nr:Major allergen Alt a 1 [Ascochyta rabiei]KZM18300.1 hypothetical protein ST47_g10580 [Ascochyta rabiei]UPX14677.1 Major allergen Alt a 1 [Ascochyta rabiei]
MQFKVIAASLLASAGLSMAAPLQAREETCPVVEQGDYVWKIDNFSARKLDGKTISSLSFNVKATNGGTLDFDCTSSDPVEDGKFYECGENSFIYFAYQADRSGLLLRQDVSDDIQYVATTTLPDYCHAGGSGPNDYICQGVSPAYITLVQYPGKLQ